MAGPLEVDAALAAATPVEAPAPIASPAAPAAPDPGSPAAAAPIVAEADKHPSEIPTLLEGVGKEKLAEPEKKDADKPKDKSAAEVAKVAEKPGEPADKPATAPADPAAPEPAPPVEYKFEFPETIKPLPEKVAAFVDLAREAKLTPEQAQRAVNIFNESASVFAANLAKETAENQTRVFNEYRAENRRKAMADPVIGGAAHPIAMATIARVRDGSISDAQPGTKQYEADLKEYNDFLRRTGSGDDPVYLKQLHRLARYVDEPSAPSGVPNPTKYNHVNPAKANGIGGMFTKTSVREQ